MDRAQIDALYRQYGHSVLRRARQILGSEADAQEVLQEVFLGLWRSDGAFGGRSSFATWVYSVTTHACLNRLRDERNRARLLGENVVPLRTSAAPSSTEERATVRQVLVRLPPEEAQAAVHYHLDGLSQAEIAEVMGCSRRHVGNLLERAAGRVRSLEESHERSHVS